MRAIVVDDEALARRELRRLLQEHAWLNVVGEAANVDEAVRTIETAAPDLVFLDIRMPGGTGFDVLERLDRVPRVIFTTAYDQHAVRAFEVNALDYLLKPVEPERLGEALVRAREHAGARGAQAPSDAADAHAGADAAAERLDRVFIQDGMRCWFVPLREVRLLSAEDDHVRLWWKDASPRVTRPLGAFERRLDPRHFFRANRSQIVNLDFVERVTPGIGGGLLIALRGGNEEVVVSRRQARELRERLGV